MPAGQRLDDLILAAVRVLVLVDQHVIEPLRLGAAHGRKLGQQLFGQQQQVVEIDGAQALEIVLITTVGSGSQLLSIGFGHGGCLVGSHRAGFPSADDSQQIARREGRIRRSQLTQRRAGLRFLLAAIANDELLRIAQPLDVPPQNSHAQRMKRRDFRCRRTRSCENLQSVRRGDFA